MRFIQKEAFQRMHEQFVQKNAATLLSLATAEHAKKPNSIYARLYTARAFALMQKFDQACEFLESIVIPFPGLIKLRLEYVEYLRRASRFSQWEIEGFRLLEEQFSLPLCFRLGRYFLQKKEWSRALSCFSRIWEQADEKWLTAQSEALNSIMGCIYYHLGNFRQAAVYLEKSSEAASLYYLAHILADKGQYALALRKLESITHLSQSRDYICLAIDLTRKMGMSDLEKSYLKQFFRLLQTKKGRLSVLQRLERLAQKTNDYALAVDALKAHYKLDNGNTTVLQNLAQVHWDFGRRELAIRLYQKVLEKKPFAADIIIRLGLFYDEHNQVPEAYNYLKMAHLGSYGTLETDLRYASLAFAQGFFAEAKGCLQSLISVPNPDPRVYWLLSRVYLHENQPDIARYYADLSLKTSAVA